MIYILVALKKHWCRVKSVTQRRKRCGLGYAGHCALCESSITPQPSPSLPRDSPETKKPLSWETQRIKICADRLCRLQRQIAFSLPWLYIQTDIA